VSAAYMCGTGRNIGSSGQSHLQPAIEGTKLFATRA
jgi:hypothetical protein